MAYGRRRAVEEWKDVGCFVLLDERIGIEDCCVTGETVTTGDGTPATTTHGRTVKASGLAGGSRVEHTGEEKTDV